MTTTAETVIIGGGVMGCSLSYNLAARGMTNVLLADRFFESIRGIDTGYALPYAFTMDYERLITIDPGQRGGKPCIRGMRITVYDVLEYLASDMSEEQILKDFPDLTREDIRACLAFAADRERRFVSIPPA